MAEDIRTTPIINKQDQGTAYPYMPTIANVGKSIIPGFIRKWFEPQTLRTPLAETPSMTEINKPAALEEWGPDIKEIFRGALSRVLEWYDNDDAIIRRDKFDTYASMMTDAKVRSAINSKRFAVISSAWAIKPASNSRIDREIAECCEMNFRRCRGTVPGMSYQVLSSLVNGYSINEMCFAPITTGKFTGQARLAALRNKDPQDFGFKLDFAGNVEEIWLGYRSPIRTPIPKWKFAIHVYLPEYDRPWGNSDLRSMWKYWWLKDKALKAWWMFIYNFASPLKVGKVPPGSKIMTPEYEQHLNDFGGENNTLIIPKDFDMVLEMAASGENHNFPAIIEYCDSMMAQAASGQTLTSSVGHTGSQALGRVHQDTGDDYNEFIRRELAEVYKEQVMKTIVDLNYGPVDEYPDFVFNPHRDRLTITNMADLKALYETPILMVKDRNDLRERIDLPPNEDWIDDSSPDQIVAPGAGVAGGTGTEPTAEVPTDKAEQKLYKMYPSKFGVDLISDELNLAYESAYDMSMYSTEYYEAYNSQYAEKQILDEGAGEPWIHIRETGAYLRARIKEPTDFQPGTFRQITFTKDPDANKQVKAIMGKLKGRSDERLTIQAYLFPKSGWSLGAVRTWLHGHLGYNQSQLMKYKKGEHRNLVDADMFDCELRLGGVEYYKKAIIKRAAYDQELVDVISPIMVDCKLAVQKYVETKVLSVDKAGKTKADINALTDLRIPKNIINQLNDALVPWVRKITFNEYVASLKNTNQPAKSIPKFDKSDYGRTDITLEVGTSAADKQKLKQLQDAGDYEGIAAWRAKKIEAHAGTQESSIKITVTDEIETETIKTVKDAVQFGIKNGQSAQDIAKAIGDVYNKYGADKNVPADKLLMIARSETTRELIDAQLVAGTDPLASDEFPAMMISEILDDATCQECVDLDGTMFAKDDPELNRVATDIHPNCRREMVDASAAEWEAYGGK